MASQEIIQVLGVYPVESEEPCDLIELTIDSPGEAFDMVAFAQKWPGKPRSSWQVAYMDQLLNAEGTRAITDLNSVFRNIPEMLDRKMRIAFFMHYLSPDAQLETPFGSVPLPRESPRPPRLEFMRYRPVD